MAVNQLISTNLVTIAIFKNKPRKERQRQSIKAAKVKDKYIIAKKIVITKKFIMEVKDLKENKNLSITQISKITGKAQSTIYKVLKNKLNYVS
jgi:DNA invertase Pin-like site-specific DNA recombinase